VCSQRLVHHGEGVRGQRVPVREHRQQHPVTGPQRRRSAAGITRYGLPGMVTMPPGSRRARTTPASAVRVSRSPGCQPSTPVTARSLTRPDSSIRPNPYTTSSGTAGTSGAAAMGRRRAGAARPCSRAPGRPRGGMTGAMSGAFMAAFPQGGAGTAPSPTRSRAACSSDACCAGNFPWLGVRGGTRNLPTCRRSRWLLSSRLGSHDERTSGSAGCGRPI
jgi:hypothetical protein